MLVKPLLGGREALPVARNRFEEFVKQAPAAAKLQQSPTDKEALFKQFQAWEAERNASAQVRGAKPQPQR